MNEKLFEEIYYGKEKMTEGFEQFLQYTSLANISPVYWIFAMSGLINIGLGSRNVEKKINVIKKWFRKTLSSVFQKEFIAIVKTVYLQHKEDFEGLHAKVALNLLDKLVKEEYPEEYERLRKEYFKDLDLIKDEINKN